MAFLAGGSRFATVDYDGLRLWDATTGKSLGHTPGSEQVMWAAFSPDRSHAVLVEHDVVTLRHAQTHALITQYAQRQAYDMGFSPDGRILATSSGDGTSLVLTSF
jgi:WD40 repeat protein